MKLVPRLFISLVLCTPFLSFVACHDVSGVLGSLSRPLNYQTPQPLGDSSNLDARMADVQEATTGFAAREYEELSLREALEELEAREALAAFSSGELFDELSRRFNDLDIDLEERAPEKFKCPYCGKTFNSKRSVRQCKSAQTWNC